MKLNKICSIIVICLGLALSAESQTTQVPDLMSNAPAVQWYNTFYTWATSENPSNQWANVDVEVGTGIKQVTGVGAQDDLNIQYDFQSRWNIGGSVQFSGVGSAINSLAGQGGYAFFEENDLKSELDLRGGYDFEKNGGSKDRGLFAEPVIMLSKLVTKNTYVKTGLGVEISQHGKISSTPDVFAETGFGHVRVLAGGAVAKN